MNDAVRAGDITHMRSALDKFPDLLHVKSPASNGLSWLHVAAMSGKSSAVGFLLGAGLPVDLLDEAGATPLRKAIAADVVQLLLDRGADPNGRGGPPPLHAAVDSESALAALLRAGPNLEARDAGGFTALMAACRRNNLASVKLLLAAGADVFAINARDRKTALDIARRRSSPRSWSISRATLPSLEHRG